MERTHQVTQDTIFKSQFARNLSRRDCPALPFRRVGSERGLIDRQSQIYQDFPLRSSFLLSNQSSKNFGSVGSFATVAEEERRKGGWYLTRKEDRRRAEYHQVGVEETHC